MTVCNMTIEGGGRAGMIAPDETTFAWFTDTERPGAPQRRRARCRDRGLARAAHRRGRRLRPRGRHRRRRASLRRSPGARTPGWSARSPSSVPSPEDFDSPADREATERALHYMALEPGTPIEQIAVDRVFIGSCTNSRIGDLRAAAEVVAGARSPPTVSAMVVPGSQQVKAQAEAEGLDRDLPRRRLRLARRRLLDVPGHEPRHPRSRASAARPPPTATSRAARARGGRTHLVSPQMAAAAAIEGHFTDIRDWS